MKARIRTHYDRIQSGFKGHEDLLFAAMDFLKRNQYDEAMEVVKEDPDAYKEAMIFDFYARRMNVDRCEQIYGMMERDAKIFVESLAYAKQPHRILQDVLTRKSMYTLRPVFQDAAETLHELVVAYYANQVDSVNAWLNQHVELAESVKFEIQNIRDVLGCTSMEAWSIVFDGLRLLDNKLSADKQ